MVLLGYTLTGKRESREDFGTGKPPQPPRHRHECLDDLLRPTIQQNPSGAMESHVGSIGSTIIIWALSNYHSPPELRITKAFSDVAVANHQQLQLWTYFL